MEDVSVANGAPSLVQAREHRANCGVGAIMDLDGGRSHGVVEDGIELLEGLQHRGTTGAEENTGDGAGILLQIPHEFFSAEVPVELPEPYAVGSLFFPKDEEAARELRRLIEEELDAHGLEVFHWRSVPTDNGDLGRTALESEPAVVQCFVAPSDDRSTEAFDRSLYVGRRAIETAVEEREPPGADRFYVCSLDRQTIVYKGLLLGNQLAGYYPDLTDDRVRSNFVLVHARFSTNTLGAWELAHPYRRIIHNGEFNTLRGNINWMRARETDLDHPEFEGDLETIRPVIADPGQSDTATVDNVLELLMQAGRELPHALRMMIPEAWRAEANDLPADREEWYDYHASLIEPWDGPALVIGTDGTRISGVLDRNGLRPCRYEVTDDDRLVLSSEVGALDIPDDAIVERGRLEPGRLFVADPEEGRVLPDAEVFDELTDPKYGEWVEDRQVRLDSLTTPDTSGARLDRLRSHQLAFGLTQDELNELIEPMVTDGKDPVGSMGDDTALSVLSDFSRPLASYFKQLFAQVSNPPVDHLRERLVFSLETRLGPQRNLLAETPEHANQLVLDSPILTDGELAAVEGLDAGGLGTTTLDITYPKEEGLEAAVERLRERASAAADGADIIVLTDREVDRDRLPIPGLLATAAVHHHLVRNGKRNRVGLVVETGDARTVHQVATLVGYGAGAVAPTLAFRTVEELVEGGDVDPEDAVATYVEALEEGLLKTMSKMGISTVESYRGAQIFEAVGLDPGFVAEYFEGTENRTGGIGIEELEGDLRERHRLGFEAEGDDLEWQGEFEHRTDGMIHEWNPTTVSALHRAVRKGDMEAYREFAETMNGLGDGLQTLRGLLEFENDRDPIPLEEVEPVESIVERFTTASMSLGSLSPEAHENLAVAMDRLGGKSGSGEGGEPPERFGTEAATDIKQVASGRFGVTSNYLTDAEVIQIKMAQGSKPGEGGHLPGHKVNELIAHTRRTVPGVGLISPPPQHDIYSIEDLKQLIHDLHAANPEAGVNVKLVAEAGVGIIAAGCAKANADSIHISGHSGGTGASPKTSIKHAGVPWELGLAEANQVLRATGLRDRVRLSVDGGLKTGRDVAVAALLGAEEYVFGTAGLVSEGCVMARQCHQNTCPVGVATQREDLRERFPGEPEHVINYMTFIAQELREIMAELGFRTLEEMIGRPDALKQREDIEHPKAKRIDLSAVLADPTTDYDIDRTKTQEQPEDDTDPLDTRLLEAAREALESRRPTAVATGIDNTDRAVGATLSNRISERYGEEGLPEDTLTVRFDGTAGQSFGAFLASGTTFELTGAANDYVGKGLSGGKLIIETPDSAAWDPLENTLIGNVALYGATEGEAYINGVAGERFAVRNSGVKAVVEGVGDHGCEYMTGGVVAVLGETGKNFAAGMSGGVAYVYDPDGTFEERCNTDMVRTARYLDDADERMLRRLIENHAAYTDSARAEELIENWETAREAFVRVVPDAYRAAIAERPDADVRKHPPSAADATGAAEAVVEGTGAD